GYTCIAAALEDVAARARIPLRIDFLPNFERRVCPVQYLTCGGNFIGAEWCTVALLLALLVRGAFADHGFAADQARALRIGAGRFDRRLDGIGIVAIDIRHHMPAVRFETLRRVVGEPAL